MHTTPGNLIIGTPKATGWSVGALQRRHRRQVAWAAAAAFLVTALAALLLQRLPYSLVSTIGLGVALPALLVWLWRAPVRGVYVLFAVAVVQESGFSAVPYPDDLGHYFPFFADFTTWTHVSGLAFSLAELFMLLVVLIWILKGIGERTLRFDPGSLMLPIGLYGLMVAVGEAHGLGSGGDFRISLWEVRAQIYMLIMYILACNLINSRRAIDILLWALILGTGFKGVQGTWRYFIELHSDLHSVNSLFDHEQSFFFNAFLTYVPILLLYSGSSRLKRIMLLLLPFVTIANFANQRRAGMLALGLGLVVLLLVTAVAHPAGRRMVAAIALLLAVVFPPYYQYYAGRDGLLAQPAHAISSNFNPDPRDASSNLYRVNEDKDILVTMRTSPIIGYGYGKPMLTPFPLADISGIYIFWNILPHDSILWIWMRLGTIGFLLFWCMIGAAVVQAATLTMRLRDPYYKGLALLILLLVLQEVVLGYLDLQWTVYRNLIVLGVLFALLSKLSRYDTDAQTGMEGTSAEDRRGAMPPSSRPGRKHTARGAASRAEVRQGWPR